MIQKNGQSFLKSSLTGRIYIYFFYYFFIFSNIVILITVLFEKKLYETFSTGS